MSHDIVRDARELREWHDRYRDEADRLRAENKSALNSITDLARQTATQAEEILRLREIITAAFEAARDDNEISAYLILRDAAMAFPSVPQAPPPRECGECGRNGEDFATCPREGCPDKARAALADR